MKKFKYPLVAAGAVALCHFAPVTAANTPAPAKATEATAPIKADVAVDVVGAVRGYVETCGCHSGNYGGIARRATYLKEVRKSTPTLAVFAGGMRVGEGDTADNASATLWKAYPAMGYDAVTLSSEDLPDFAKMPEAARKLVTLANVTTADGKPLAPGVLYKDIKAADGKTVHVAVIGLLGKSPYLTAPNPETSPDDLPWKVSDPKTALQEVLPAARKKADMVVVLYAGTRDPARTLLQEVPGVDVMVVGMEGTVDKTVEKVGNSALVQNAERGRFGVTLGVNLDKDEHPESFTLRNVPISEVYADDPAMAKLVKAFRDRMAAAATANTRGFVPARGVPASGS